MSGNVIDHSFITLHSKQKHIILILRLFHITINFARNAQKVFTGTVIN